MQKENNWFDVAWPLSSMTGFGGAEASQDNVSIEVVARSVNFRGLDVKCRLPDELSALEPSIHKLISAQFSRGRIEIDAKVQTSSFRTNGFTIDEDVAQVVFDKFIALQRRFTGIVPVTMRDVLAMPGVVRLKDIPSPVSLLELGEKAVKDALNDLKQARGREGQLLEGAIKNLLKDTGALISAIHEMARSDVNNRFHRLKDRLDELPSKFGFSEDRLLQEFALLVERSDFTEEIDRLHAHTRHFAGLCQTHDAVGRKLDFLCQEMLREVNTLLSKASEGQITVKAIDLKAGIERMREQVQNIE